MVTLVTVVAITVPTACRCYTVLVTLQTFPRIVSELIRVSWLVECLMQLEGVQCVVCVHVQGMYVGCVCMWGIWECVGRRGWEEGRKKIS